MAWRTQNFIKLSELTDKYKEGSEHRHRDVTSLCGVLFVHSLCEVELFPCGTAASNRPAVHHPDMNMEHQWNWQENTEVLRNLWQSHYVHHKPHVTCAGVKLRPPRCGCRQTASVMSRPLYILTKRKRAKCRPGVHKRGIQVVMATSRNFVRQRLIFVGPKYETCFISPFWRLKFWDSYRIFLKFVNPDVDSKLHKQWKLFSPCCYKCSACTCSEMLLGSTGTR